MATDEKCNCDQAIALTEYLRGVLVTSETAQNPAEGLKAIRSLASEALLAHGAPEQPKPYWEKEEEPERLSPASPNCPCRACQEQRNNCS